LPWIELGINEQHYAKFYFHITGHQVTLDELLKKSNALYDLTRLINTRLGMSRKDDTLPYKVSDCPIQAGPTAGKVVDSEDFQRLLDLYYQKRGWDKNGVPPAELEEQFA
jgi:aldehyde:ferredoxin oxidoreductase